MTRWTPLLSLALLIGCTGKDVVTDSAPVGPADADGDGYDEEQDCDDLDASIYPGAEEVCDGVDNDCDGEVDVGASDAGTWYPDGDADGYGDDASPIEACETPSGAVGQGGDCDDDDPAYNPGAVEDDCTDPNDYNCDGSVGYADADGDGFPACEDCDDGDAEVHPDASEVCDGVDNDCDGLLDDADDSLDLSTASTWYGDGDSDGYGDPGAALQACEAPSGAVADSSDCDDGDAAVNPGAVEVCNDLDDDCDGLVDDADSDLDASTGDTWYSDVDGDGYGDASSAVQACAQPSGVVEDDTDCDDGDADAYPDALETLDGDDDDCDSAVDEAAVAMVFGMQCLDNSGSTTYTSAELTQAESDALEGYLSDMSLGMDRYDEDSSGWTSATASLEDYDLVLYSKCGWSWIASNQGVVDALLDARDQGVPTFVFDDDVTWYDTNVTGEESLTLMPNGGSNGASGTVTMTGASHDAYAGPYGTPSDFVYDRDLDETTTWGNGETVLATHSGYGGPVWAVYEDSSNGSRASCYVGNFYATNHDYLTETADGEVLFKNTVSWLLDL